MALRRHTGPASAGTLRKAADWLLREQHDDGSWGRWEGTAEETAYAVRTLLDLTDGGSAWTGPAAHAVSRGCAFLLDRGLDTGQRPPLWIGKELYGPAHLVRAALLGALAAAQRRSAGDNATQPVY